MTRTSPAARLGAALVALVLAAGLAACSSDEEAPDPLTFWSVTMAPHPVDDERILDRTLSEFTEATGVEVEVEVIDWLDLYPRIEVALSSGEGPDVLTIGNTWSVPLSAAGALMPWDDEALSAIGGPERFRPTALDASGPEGGPPTSVPYLGQSYGLYYDREAFEEAGVAGPPTTWEEFVGVARQLTDRQRWGVALAGAEWTSNAHLAFLLSAQNGGALFDKKGAPSFDTDPVRRAVGSMVAWMGSDGILDPELAGADRVRDLAASLVDGEVAMIIATSGMRSNLADLEYDDYGVAPLPTSVPANEEDRPVRSIVGGTNLALWSQTDQRDEALQLVEHLTTTDTQRELNQAFGTLPVVPELDGDPAFEDERLQTFLSVYRDASAPMPAHPDEGRMEAVLGQTIGTLWERAAEGPLAPTDVQTALAEAEQAMATP
ncbi:sugar ABC transporter substrate-binding protein [Nocardioides panacisoli]|uniref:ABC transporter substrate-binding protein n=1 Tax=Nocardioides panacisoli TaxID=627624 RepID=UPI001C6342B0|nr:sugar ABC transporter substrate-binding protein [Nocardioides panacisoli]QYJ03994.1 sugar ABC transporter substrate-binding protein [Nocardioides panacisoli]